MKKKTIAEDLKMKMEELIEKLERLNELEDDDLFSQMADDLKDLLELYREREGI